MLNDIQKSILKTVSDMTGIPDGAVNIRPVSYTHLTLPTILRV